MTFGDDKLNTLYERGLKKIENDTSLDVILSKIELIESFVHTNFDHKLYQDHSCKVNKLIRNVINVDLENDQCLHDFVKPLLHTHSDNHNFSHNEPRINS